MINNIINFIKTDDYLISIYNSHVYIFNYGKILDISENKISITFEKINIVIKGEKLLIEKMDLKEILICGNIKGIELL